MSAGTSEGRTPIPRDPDRDHSEGLARRRREFIADQVGTDPIHMSRYSIDPSTLRGNIENFVGVAQVPVGIAGPLRIHGEHASGDLYVPLATTEGTLVASYSRGMRLLTENGGVTATVIETSMQRAPAFVLDDAVTARKFGTWVSEHFQDIKEVADATTNAGSLISIFQHAIGPLRMLRFNYTTGDAAGQNMTGRATHAACEWIRSAHPTHPDYVLSGNFDTDKKYSSVNTLLTRGRRVVAEATLRDDLLRELMGVNAETLFRWRQVSNVGAFASRAASNGAHAANGLAALFIATGQDVANVAESHAAITYSQLLPSGDYYWSVTLPSLIVGTFGGGTGLATQREGLEMLGCYGAGNADKFAEICAGVVLAGEISLSAAVVHGDWVSSHEALGRNRP